MPPTFAYEASDSNEEPHIYVSLNFFLISSKTMHDNKG